MQLLGFLVMFLIGAVMIIPTKPNYEMDNDHGKEKEKEKTEKETT